VEGLWTVLCWGHHHQDHISGYAGDLIVATAAIAYPAGLEISTGWSPYPNYCLAILMIRHWIGQVGPIPCLWGLPTLPDFFHRYVWIAPLLATLPELKKLHWWSGSISGCLYAT
jgi:hypothetical protein